MNKCFMTLAAALALGATQTALAQVGYGAGTTGGGSKTAINVATLAAAQAAIDAYKDNSGLVLNYTGTFNFSTITDVCAQWQKPAQTLSIKNKSNITLRGANGSAANFGIHVAGASSNVIIQNMTIGMLQGGEAADSISLEGMSSGTPSNIWVDHNTIFARNIDCPGAGDATFDGGIDLKKGVKNVTISYNHVHDYQKVSLNGFSDSDTSHDAARTTYHHNRFENVKSRLPLQRRGMTHIFSNYFNNVGTSGINVRMGGMSLIESNYFENVKNPVTSRDSSAIGYWDLRNNYVGGGITWDQPSSSVVNATNWATTKAFGSTGYSYTVTPAACVKTQVIATAGAGKNLATASTSCSASSASSSVASSSSSVASSSSSVASSSSSSVASSSSSAASSSSSTSGAPALTGTSDYPTGFSKCSDANVTCSVTKGTGWVAFGRKGKWVARFVGVGKSIPCTVAAFGSDPGGNPNKCAFQN